MSKIYYWLKLKKDFFKSKQIKKIRKIAGGDTYTLIYMEMLLLSLDNEGKIYFDGFEEDFAEEIALEIDEDTDNVRFAMTYFMKYGLIERVEEGDDYIIMHEAIENTGKESESAERVRRHRLNKKKEEALQCNAKLLQCNTKLLQCNNSVTDCNTEKEKEKENIYSQESSNSEQVQNDTSKFAKDSVPYILSTWMDNCISDTFSELQLKYKQKDEKTLQKWSVVIDRMLRIDGITKEEFCDTFRAIQNDDFWCRNILSPDKFRKQFENISLKLEKEIKKIRQERC